MSKKKKICKNEKKKFPVGPFIVTLHRKQLFFKGGLISVAFVFFRQKIEREKKGRDLEFSILIFNK